MRGNSIDAVPDSAIGKLYSVLQTVMGVSGATGKFIVENLAFDYVSAYTMRSVGAISEISESS